MSRKSRKINRPKRRTLEASGVESQAPAEKGSSSVKRQHSKRIWFFRILALIGIPVLLFGGFELTLRQLGYGYPASFLVLSPSSDRFLVDNYRFAWRFFPPALARSSQPIVVARDKPADVTRIVVFGGSAAMGDPEAAFGFPRMLQILLEARCPERNFEVINAAVTAVNSHVVYQIAQDCRRLHADAWVVYMGNNEVHGPFGSGTVFGGARTPLWVIRSSLAFQRTKTGQLLSRRRQRDTSAPASWGGLKMFLDHQVKANSSSVRRVYENFQSNLNNLIDLARHDQTPMVISTVVSNLRDCAPFSSAHRDSLTSAEAEAWRRAYDRACTAMDAGRWDEASSALRQALEIDATYADAHYRLATCLNRQGQQEKALQHFENARDYDTLRFRADGVINRIIATTSVDRHAQGVHFVDAVKTLADGTEDGIIGEEFLYEHVHFNFHGNYQLAKLFAENLIQVLELPHDENTDDGWPSEVECSQRLGWSPFHQMRVTREMITRSNGPPFTQQSDHTLRLERLNDEVHRLEQSLSRQVLDDWIARYREQLVQFPDDCALRQQLSYLFEAVGDHEGSIAESREITRRLPHHAEAFCQLGVTLNRAKQYADAEPSLRRALTLHPSYARALNSLGICLSHLGRQGESYQCFTDAVTINPTYAEAQFNWGLVLASQGKQDAAVEHYRAAVLVNEDYLPAHLKLGQHLVSVERSGEALPHYQAVVRLKPNDAAALTNLGLLYLKLAKPSKSIACLERAAALSPSSEIVKRALARARHSAEHE